MPQPYNTQATTKKQSNTEVYTACRASQTKKRKGSRAHWNVMGLWVTDRAPGALQQPKKERRKKKNPQSNGIGDRAVAFVCFWSIDFNTRLFNLLCFRSVPDSEESSLTANGRLTDACVKSHARPLTQSINRCDRSIDRAQAKHAPPLA